MSARQVNGMLAALVVIALAGCKDEKQATTAATADGTPFQQAVLQRLKASGLAVGEFEQAAAKPYAAKACVRGKISKLDVLLCNYGDAKEAQGKEAQLRGFAGSAVTGAVRIDKAIAIAVADRDKVDLKGKQINALLATFLGAPGEEPS